MAFYLATLAPGLTWANGGSDGGDLITAVATNGIAHPTGYPTYLLLAEIFEILPFSTLAYRLNMLSAIASTAAAMVIYWIVTKSSVDHIHQAWNSFAGLIAGLAYGLAPMVWGQAVITEVYALHGFLTALILYFSSREPPSMSRHLIAALCGLILGLAVGNHVTTILMVPVYLTVNGVQTMNGRSLKTLKFDLGSILWQLTFLILGLLVYLILPLRASTDTAMNWGNPVTLDRFWWLISGKLYQENLLDQSMSLVWSRLQALASLSLQQFGLVGVFFATVGLIVFYIPDRLNILCLLQAFIHSTFAIIYTTPDSYFYLIPVWISFAVWMGHGIIGVREWLGPARRIFGWLVSAILLVSVLMLASLNFSHVDASKDLRAELFGRQIMASTPKDAFVFVGGDRAVFTLWYFHLALRERDDLVVVAEDLLHFDWYQEALRSYYPSLLLPEPFPLPETIAAANPQRPICYVEYREQALMDCSQPKQNNP